MGPGEMALTLRARRMIGWVAVVFALQSWLAETAEQRRTAATPAYFSVGMSCKSPLGPKRAVTANVNQSCRCLL
jgi:hypothetical protein